VICNAACQTTGRIICRTRGSSYEGKKLKRDAGENPKYLYLPRPVNCSTQPTKLNLVAMKPQVRFPHCALLGSRVQCNTRHSRHRSDISCNPTLASSPRLSTHQDSTSSAPHSNWHTIKDQPLTSSSLRSLFSNNIPSIRHRNLLSSQECQHLVDVVNTHTMVCISNAISVTVMLHLY
jgi:hypothetical protein